MNVKTRGGTRTMNNDDSAEKSYFFNAEMQALFEKDMAERIKAQPKPIATTPHEPSPILRYVRVFLGIAWGIFRGVVTIIFSVIAVFLLLAALAGEWSKAPEKPARLGSGGPESEQFFKFMNGVTAPLQWAWSGFVILVQVFVLLLVFAAQATWTFLTNHELLAWTVATLGVASYLVWTCVDEWRREFDEEYEKQKYREEDRFLQVDGGPHWIKGLFVVAGVVAVQIWAGWPLVWEFLVEAYHAMRS
jgi:hypothetical protein